MRGHGSTWLISILVLLGVSPFIFGLFQDLHLLAVAVIVFAMLTVFLWKMPRRVAWVITPLDMAVFALAGLYLLAVLWAVSPRAALQEAIKNLVYLSVYFMVSRSVRNPADRLWFVKVLTLITAVVGLGSVVLATGWIPYAAAVESGRLNGPFQYPNATAAYLLIGMGTSLGLRSAATRTVERFTWSLSLFTVVYVVLFSYSRIGWAAAAVAVLLVLLLAPRGKRLDLILAGLPSLVAVAAVAIPSDLAMQGERYVQVFLLYVGGLLLTAATDMAVVATARRKWGLRSLVLIGGLGTVAVIALVIMKAPTLVARLGSISVSNQSLILRLHTYEDAIRALWEEGPVLGLGGGGWSAVYRGYMSSSFVSKLVHSSLLETMVELGLPGAFLLVGTWFLGTRAAWRLRNHLEYGTPAVVWTGLLAGTLGLLVHSLLDFDWWYPALTMAVFAILGLWRSVEPVFRTLEKKERELAWIRPVALGVAVLFSVGALPLFGSAWYSGRAKRALAQQEMARAQSYRKQAVSLDPLSASVRSDYGDLLLETGLATKRAALVREAEAMFAQAIRLDPHNPDYQIMYANYAMILGKHPEALTALEQASILDPMTADTYMRALRHALLNVQNSLEDGKSTEAKEFLQRAKEIVDRFNENEAGQRDDLSNRLLLRHTPELDLYIAQFAAFSGDLQMALELLNRTEEVKGVAGQTRAQVLLWEHVIATASGEVSEVERTDKALMALDRGLLAQSRSLQAVLRKALTELQ